MSVIYLAQNNICSWAVLICNVSCSRVSNICGCPHRPSLEWSENQWHLFLTVAMDFLRSALEHMTGWFFLDCLDPFTADLSSHLTVEMSHFNWWKLFMERNSSNTEIILLSSACCVLVSYWFWVGSYVLPMHRLLTSISITHVSVTSYWYKSWCKYMFKIIVTINFSKGLCHCLPFPRKIIVLYNRELGEGDNTICKIRVRGYTPGIYHFLL